jgi:hypothetical protein
MVGLDLGSSHKGKLWEILGKKAVVDAMAMRWRHLPCGKEEREVGE